MRVVRRSNCIRWDIISDYNYSIHHACRQNKAMIKQQLSVNIKRNSFRKTRRGNRIKEEELSNLNNKDYIEVARDDYYLSNKGEVIFKLPNNDDSKSKSSNDN